MSDTASELSRPAPWRSAYERGRTLLAEDMPERAAEALRDAVARGGEGHAEVWIALGEAIVATLPPEVRGETKLYTGRATPPGEAANAAAAEHATEPTRDERSVPASKSLTTTAAATNAKAATGYALLVRNARSLTEAEARAGAQLGELESIAEMLLELDASSRPAARLLRIVDQGRASLAARASGVGRARMKLAGRIALDTTLIAGGAVALVLWGKTLLVIGAILLVLLIVLGLVAS